MKGKKKNAKKVKIDPFVVMDNGTRFYLHVIGITPLSLASKKRRSSRA
jgi:hypothetical protein